MDDTKVKLSEQETFDVLAFAKALTDYNSLYGLGVYTPDIVNTTLKHLNVNPQTPTEHKIATALNRPNENEDKLVSYSEWYNVNNMLYRRTNDYLANLLAFDLNITCSNAKGAEYNSKEYKEDLNKIYEFLDRLRYQREFPKIVKNMLRQETVFTSFRTDAWNYAIQQLPSQYCKITGYTSGTMLFDFNMQYFIAKVGVDIDNYAPIFKEYYMDIMKTDSDDTYIPSNKLTSRTGEWVYWHQTSINDGFFAFKFSPEIFTKIPYLAPMMKDVQQTDLIRNLQMNKNIAGARALILGEIGFLDGTAGQKADMFNINPTTLAVFMQLIKSGLEDAYRLGGAPLTDMEKFQFEDLNPDMYLNQLKNNAGQSVSLSRLLFATDKFSQTEAILALENDGNLMSALYQQFNDFLNFYANRVTSKYKFVFEFEGLNYSDNRDGRLDRALELADRGIVLPQKIQCALGMTPQAFTRMMDESKHSKFTEKLTQLISIHTATGASEKGKKRKRRVSSESRDYDDTN